MHVASIEKILAVLDAASVRYLIAGIPARLVPIDLLIAMKLAASRASDLIDIESLRTLQQLDE